MRGLRVLILVCASVSALAAMWMMRSALQSQANMPAPVQVAEAPEPTVQAPVTAQVLVANREIATGRVIQPEDLRWQSWPADSVSESFYTEGEDVDAIETLTGAASRLVIVEGEPITSNKIVDLNGTGVLAALLRPGMRAISIPISEITSAGGFILPGDFVDILLTRQISIEEIDEETGEVDKVSQHHQTDTIMKTVRVLAIDQQLNESENAASVGNSATLELLPAQVELITLTRQMAQQERGFLTLSLRSFKEMINEYGDDIENVMPQTALDLHALVRERLADAEKTKSNYLEYAARKSNEVDVDLDVEPVEDDPVVELPEAPAKQPPATVTLIRNGAPIVVHTITPSGRGSK